MIDHDTWLGFGINRKSTVFTDKVSCSIGGYIPDTNHIDIDIYSPQYYELSFIHNWIGIGLQNGWIEKLGCVKHELDKFNFVLDLDNIILMNTYLLPPLTHKPDNKEYFEHQISLRHTAELLFTEGQKSIPTKSIIDIGCGMGWVLELAKDFGYTDLSGIDVQQELIDIAKNKTDADLLNIAAEKYFLPEKQVHIYMFNPFSNNILDKFLKNNIENIKRNNSCILYNNNFTAHHLMLHYGLTSIYNNSFSGIYKFA
jgi:hypothetical protein